MATKGWEAYSQAGKKVAKKNKYSAVKQNYNGYNYDSKFEASGAMALDWRLKAGEIKGWSRQKGIDLYEEKEEVGTGKMVWVRTARWRVDFYVEHLDGSFEFLEYKGLAMPDFKRKEKLLKGCIEKFYPNHIYTVVYK